jgi:hypothetical protein
MEKYKKIPNFVWILIFVVTIFLANAVESFEQTGALATEVIKAYEAAGMSVKQSGVVTTLVILSTLLYALLFELLARWLTGELVRRFSLKVDSRELVFMVRLVLSVANLIFALVSLLYFVNYDAQIIVKSSLTIPVISGLFIWFYATVRERIVPSHLQARFFSFVAKVYFGINIVLSAFYFISNMFIYDIALTPIDIATLSIELGVSLIMAAVAYLYAIRLKKVETIIEIKKVDNDPFKFEIIEEEKKEEKVFKDFDI